MVKNIFDEVYNKLFQKIIENDHLYKLNYLWEKYFDDE